MAHSESIVIGLSEAELAAKRRQARKLRIAEDARAAAVAADIAANGENDPFAACRKPDTETDA